MDGGNELELERIERGTEEKTAEEEEAETGARLERDDDAALAIVLFCIVVCFVVFCCSSSVMTIERERQGLAEETEENGRGGDRGIFIR